MGEKRRKEGAAGLFPPRFSVSGRHSDHCSHSRGEKRSAASTSFNDRFAYTIPPLTPSSFTVPGFFSPLFFDVLPQITTANRSHLSSFLTAPGFFASTAKQTEKKLIEANLNEHICQMSFVANGQIREELINWPVYS